MFDKPPRAPFVSLPQRVHGTERWRKGRGCGRRKEGDFINKWLRGSLKGH